MKAAVEHHFNGPTAPLTGSYDSTKTLIASLLQQTTGSNAEDNYITTQPSEIVNIPEVAISSQFMPHVIKWSNNIYWVFACTNATAAVTRTVTLFEFNSTAQTITYKGYITLSGTTIAGVKAIRSLRGFVYEHTTGTVSTSGASTTITGNSTQFTTERIAVGARIGFGTTDPTQVTTWYEITAITNDTSLTISGPVTLSAGTSYVIEEVRVALAVTNATIINGGIHLIKGLNYDTFAPGGTTIPEATTVDNIRASYLLKDASVAGGQTATVSYSTTNILSCTGHGLAIGDVVYFTTTNTLPTGLTINTAYYVIATNYGVNQFSISTAYGGAIASISAAGSGTHTVHPGSNAIAATLATDDQIDNTDHPAYLVNATSTTLAATITKYNLRAALTVGALTGGPSSGVSPSAFILKTNPMSITGTVSQVNSGRIFSVSHGASSGVTSLWFTTTTRIFRCPIANITAGSISWLGDFMIEVPPGGSTTYSALSTMSQVDYSATIDKLFITNTGGRLGTYVTQYNTTGDQFDKYIGANLSRLKLTTTPTGTSDGLFPQGTPTIWTEDGWMFVIPSSTTSGGNWLYIFPFAADSSYIDSSQQYIITPKLATPNVTKLYSVYIDHMEYAGTYNLGFPVESYKIWYRTSGIDNNSGAWTEVLIGADLTAAAYGEYIQFKIAFDIMGEICVPTRIYSICCVYEDGSQDSHYEPSLTKSSAQNRQFAWRQIVGWGGTIPNLRIRLFNIANNATVLDDNVTSNTYGTWEYSTDGGNTWLAWSSSADTIGNYIRYTADNGVLGNGITVRALLTQA